MLDELVGSARRTIASGFYGKGDRMRNAPSLVAAIQTARADGGPAIIAEAKPASPTRGKMLAGGIDALLGQYVADAADAISVLTEPSHFHGSLSYLSKAVDTGLPVLMKDFFLDERQVDCAARRGASAILLISDLLDGKRLQELIEYAHLAKREVVLEVADEAQFAAAQATDADLVGINNRDLRTFKIDMRRTQRILSSATRSKPVVSMSGYSTSQDIERFARDCDGVLVGSSLVDGTVTIPELRAT